MRRKAVLSAALCPIARFHVPTWIPLPCSPCSPVNKDGESVTEGWEAAAKALTGSSISATGLIVASPKPGQVCERLEAPGL